MVEVLIEDLDSWYAVGDDDDTMVDMGGGYVVPLSELLYVGEVHDDEDAK